MFGKTLIVIIIGFCLSACHRSGVLSQAGISENAQRGSGMPVIRFGQTDPGVIEVAGLNPAGLAKLRRAGLSPAEWEILFAVHPNPAVGPGAPAMLGSYDVQADAIRFTPRFPLVPGLAYNARFDLFSFHRRFDTAGSPPAQPVIEVELALPKKPAGSKTIVTEIYPSANELPANQLKFYIFFSAPMSVGEAYERIHLFDEEGREAPHTFLRIDQELWDPARRRFTLLFDPGRIKRGLRPNVEAGAPLKAGKRYRLLVDREWHDGDGNPLEAGFEKWFAVTAADRKAPDYRAWKIIVPSATTREPLKLIFDEALDRPLLEETLSVIDASGNRIEGRIEIAKGETEWLLTPNTAWKAGNYNLLVDENLEDRAGNNLRRLFDADLNEQPPARIERNRIRLSFDIRPLGIRPRISIRKSSQPVRLCDRCVMMGLPYAKEMLYLASLTHYYVSLERSGEV